MQDQGHDDGRRDQAESHVGQGLGSASAETHGGQLQLAGPLVIAALAMIGTGRGETAWARMNAARPS